MSKEFEFSPATWLPKYDKETLDYVRSIKREDMEYTNENGFSVKIVLNPVAHFILDMFYRIQMSDLEDKSFTMICPNSWARYYTAIANMINKFNINCRNVNGFAMDEWADEDGNVAPLTYGAGLGYSFYKHFYYQIREDLRPPLEQWHSITNETKGDDEYSKLIEEAGDGGADVIYSATGWPGHSAFIDPNTEAFKADSLEEYLKIGSRLVEQHPLTTAENSLFASAGASGDVWNIPPKAVTIGPKDIANARERVEVHAFVNPGGDSWQRMISRLELYGPISMQCPASILRLGKGTCYVSEGIARPFSAWTADLENKDLY